MKSFVIQNADVAAKKSDYSHLAEDELLVHGEWFTIQGEGPHAGRPAYFVRLGGCNFGLKTTHCQWCDTSFHLKDSKPEKFTDILDRAAIAFGGIVESPFIVITGGEPFLNPNLVAFVKEATSDYDAEIQIETNGTQARVLMWDALKEGADIVISPKAGPAGYAHAGPFATWVPPEDPDYGDMLTSVFDDILDDQVSYKFVVTADTSDQHHSLPDWVQSITPEQVFLSPMTVYKRPYSGEVSSVWDSTLVDQEATAANYKYVAELAMKHKFRVSVQMHTFLGIA